MKTAQPRHLALALLAALAMFATACTDEPDGVGSDAALAIEEGDRPQPASVEASSQQPTATDVAPTPSSNTLGPREDAPLSELNASAAQPIAEDPGAVLANAVAARLDEVATISTPTGDWMVIVSPPADLTAELVSATDDIDGPPEGHVFVGIDAMVALIEADTPQIPAEALVWQIAGGASKRLYTVESGPACRSQDPTLELSESFATYDSVSATLCGAIPAEDFAHQDTQIVLHTSAQVYWKFDQTAFHRDGEMTAAWESNLTDWSAIGPGSPIDITVGDDNEPPVAFVAIYEWEPEQRSITDLGCGLGCDQIVTNLLAGHDGNIPHSAVLARTFCNGCDSLNLLAVFSDEASPSGYKFADRDEFIELIIPIDTGFEAMIATSSPGHFRQVDGTWRSIGRSLLSDCSPIIRRHSMMEIDSNGSIRELEFADRYEGTDCNY